MTARINASNILRMEGRELKMDVRASVRQALQMFNAYGNLDWAPAAGAPGFHCRAAISFDASKGIAKLHATNRKHL